MIMVDTVVCEWSWWTLVWVAHLIVDSGESGAVTADLVITLSSQSIVALGGLAPS